MIVGLALVLEVLAKFGHAVVARHGGLHGVAKSSRTGEVVQPIVEQFGVGGPDVRSEGARVDGAGVAPSADALVPVAAVALAGVGGEQEDPAAFRAQGGVRAHARVDVGVGVDPRRCLVGSLERFQGAVGGEAGTHGCEAGIGGSEAGVSLVLVAAAAGGVPQEELAPPRLAGSAFANGVVVDNEVAVTRAGVAVCGPVGLPACSGSVAMGGSHQMRSALCKVGGSVDFLLAREVVPAVLFREIAVIDHCIVEVVRVGPVVFLVVSPAGIVEVDVSHPGGLTWGQQRGAWRRGAQRHRAGLAICNEQ